MREPRRDDRPVDARGRFANRAVGCLMAGVSAAGLAAALFLIVVASAVRRSDPPIWNDPGTWIVGGVFSSAVLSSVLAGRFALARLSGPPAPPPGSPCR